MIRSLTDFSRNRIVVLLIILSVISPLFFSLYTGQVWEDFFISFRHSVNLIEGHGLSYRIGERVQGFSSPFAVLIEACCYFLSGGSTSLAIWIMRLLGITAYAMTLILLVNAWTRVHGHTFSWATIIVSGMYLLESKTVAFAGNGMETSFLLMFAASALLFMSRGINNHYLAIGLSWGGMMWTRPDGAVYILSMCIAILLFSSENRTSLVRNLIKAGALCAAVYLPWIMFASFYYGTPIPLTISAKQAYAGGLSAGNIAHRLFNIPRVLPLIFVPPWAQNGGWFSFFPFSMVLGVIGTCYWLNIRGKFFERCCSFMAFSGIVYLSLANAFFPWYFPVILLLTLPPLKAFIGFFERLFRDRIYGGRWIFPALGSICLIIFAFLYIDYANLARLTMEINEKGNREVIGIWLKENAMPRDRVFLECPGVIGFYSGLHMLDYPGLVSPEVVAVNKKHRGGMAAAGLHLVPEWLVLRPQELQLFINEDAEAFRRHYEVQTVFDQSSRLLESIPKRHRAALYDSRFFVLKRNPSLGQ